MDRSIIYLLLGRAMTAMTLAYMLPIYYALFGMQDKDMAIFFALLLLICAVLAVLLTYKGRIHRQRIRINESVVAMITVWWLLAIFGAIPFIMTLLSPVDAILETVSDLTAAGLSLLPQDAPYILKLWQAILMWLGSFIFLSILVTILPEVSGCFGLELSLSQGQIFSPMLGQMRFMAKKILLIYELLTFISFVMFKLAGLDNWDAISMAMRCISTGGGDFFPGKGNFYVEYAAIFSMLLACGNFLLYFRLMNTIIPPTSSLNITKPIDIKNFAKKIHLTIKTFFSLMRRNARSNLRIFISNSEVQFLLVTIFISTLIITFTIFNKDYLTDGNASFRIALFHVVSYISTTGITLTNLTNAPDAIRFLLFLLVLIGGCMGSVTGGLKIIRIIILFKLAAIETIKVIHPRMITSIKVNSIAVPMKIVGRVLSFFFLSSVTLFIFSVILSLSGQPFSTSVAMSAACLTNIGTLPGICESATFVSLPAVMKLVCCFILIIGRIEIFAFLILIGLINLSQERNPW
ncbi:MAG: TrkH family potassium uptake protein [Selenomonadaceae bacterium]|nr:TrkH family potassium uptake protein [Selenomonadaceae bacterium]